MWVERRGVEEGRLVKVCGHVEWVRMGVESGVGW